MKSTAHSEGAVYVAMECGRKEWKLAFGDGENERQVTVSAGRVEALERGARG